MYSELAAMLSRRYPRRFVLCISVELELAASPESTTYLTYCLDWKVSSLDDVQMDPPKR